MLAPRRHTFSHFQLAIQPALLELAGVPPRIAEGSVSTWVDPASPGNLGLPAPIRQLLEELVTRSPTLTGGANIDSARQE
jgi:A/G-specific adenine glycosylase